MITKFTSWLLGLSPRTRIFFLSLSNAAVFYFAAVLSSWVNDLLANNNEYWKVALHAAIFVAFLGLAVFVARIIQERYTVLTERAEKRRILALSAYQECDSIAVRQSRSLESRGVGVKVCIVHHWGDARERIQWYVDSAYAVLESSYGRSSIAENRIDFEVTFMTKSLVDGKITVPAAANRRGVMPTSMQLRIHNPDIYDRSVTAQVYRADSPRTVITPDTSDPQQYESLYADQKVRIKSAIVHPVLSPSHRLLGTLVAHCDKVEFFKKEDQKHWIDFLDIFSTRIAMEMLELMELKKLKDAGGMAECNIPELDLF